ncbi:MAG: ABC transporter permease [Emergencia timonensis]|uniref:ABC transporter permease n=1 Tax=Emergencia timonensis TaxID=1776384 RepID=UPI00082D20B0|nr:ABC transporter permease [Emergencia timonensis]WNX89485.1 ABC transporter permease [Emergencia timonensis]
MEQTTITKTQENTELTRDLFTFVEQDDAGAEKMYAPSISYWQDAWRRLKQNRVAMASLLFILVLTAFAIVAPMMSSSTHSDVDFGVMNQGLSAEHWFGTDNLGRDLWCRVWMGARVSLFIALVAAVVQSTIGIIIGGVSGFFGGKIDLFLMRASDIIDSIPFLVYVILIMMIMGSGMAPIIIAFALTGWIRMARLVRGQALSLKESDYVMASKGLGGSNMRIIIKHMVPNMLGVIIVTLTMSIPTAIFTEAYLSYIGIGLQPPLTSWGQLANIGATVIKTYPYQMIIPAIFISLTMLSMQLFGDGLRDALDPKLRK